MTTIRDVAKLAGVSPSTASRAMHDSNLISDKTKEKVRKAMEELNFSPNYAAQSLANRFSKTIGVILPIKEESVGQTINVALGGSLYQDMSLQEKESGHPVIQHMQKYNRSYLSHHVVVEPGTRMAAIIGDGTRETNSMHHQAIRKLGEGLKVSARACDGTFEAVEDEEGLIVGTQWHPEDLIDSAPVMNRIFADLVERAGKFRSENSAKKS